MNVGEALKLIKDTPSDHTQSQRWYRGLTILAKYDSHMHPSFERDQMWVGNFAETVEQMTPEEVRDLARYGWFFSQDSWSHFS